jgi:hypothetical protein
MSIPKLTVSAVEKALRAKERKAADRRQYDKPTRTGVSADLEQPSRPKGRVCSHEPCKTILSIYNRETLCALHTRQALQSVPWSNTDYIEMMRKHSF